MKTPVLESLFNKVACLQVCCNFIKKSLQHVFCCEYCEFCKNNFFTEHLRTIASAWPMAPNLLKNLEIKLSLKGTLCAFLNDSFRSWLRIYWLEIKVIVTGNVTKLTTSSMDIISRGAYLWCSFQIHNTSRDLRYTERWRFSVTPLWS